MFRSSNIFSISSSILQAKILGVKKPIFVAWELTNRCNAKCGYCDAWALKENELSKKEIFLLIDELTFLGGKFISFTGGEPLLREDLGEIISYCKSKALHVCVNSNGSLIEERFASVKDADLLTLSLDGPENVHDHIRGEGSFERVLKAAKIIKGSGIALNFATTLNKSNLDQIEFLIQKSGECGATITFQPALKNALYSDRHNLFSCPEEDHRQAINRIISYKKAPGGRVITNSFTTLEHLYHWPNKKRIKCASGYIACRIKSNGDVCLCNRTCARFTGYNAQAIGLKKAFYALPEISCDECWCAQRVEINLLFAIKWEAILNSLFLLIGTRR